MSRWIDADIYVTIRLYDDEHEEYRDEQMTIADCLDRFTDEGCPTESNPKSEWTPCSERLPKDKRDVLIQFGWNMAVGCIDCGDWRINSGNDCCTDVIEYEGMPVAWMPLPPAYKGVK